MADESRKLEQVAGGLHCAAVSDVGMRRANNQDSMAIALSEDPKHWRCFGHLLVVADGMGAHAAGELASKLATDTIPHVYQKQPADSPSEAITEAVRQANLVIHNKGQDTVDFQGMGTTCSCLLLLPAGALVAHVGDSRVYRLRGGRLDQLTFDHSLVWEMAAAGHATEEEVPAYVPKNVITRSLGPHPTVAIDLEGPFPIEPGDRFLLCSDGLTGPLKPELIGMVLGAVAPAEASQTLVDLANLLGGPDNITVVVAEVDQPSHLGQPKLADVARSGRESFGSRRSHASRPWLWGAAAALVSASGFLASTQQTAAAIACGFMGAVVAVVAFAKSRQRGLVDDGQLIGLHGKAPYRSHDCSPESGAIETLTDIVRQLEDIETQREWNFDWSEIHNDRQQAHTAMAAGKFQDAVVSYASAVRRLMQAVRQLRSEPPPSDSSINLTGE